MDPRQHANAVSQLANGYKHALILFAAHDAGVFPFLRAPRSAEEVAAEAGWDARAARMLLDALTGMGLLEKQDRRYVNAALASACLVPEGPAYQGHILRHTRGGLEGWLRLEESLRTGEAAPRERQERSPGELRDFILGMSDIAKMSAREMLDHVEVSPFREMLDVGGGPGTYSHVFLEANPDLRATVFDLPDVIAIAREEAAKAGLAGRMSFIEGDYAVDDVGSGYDLVLASNIIHSLSEEQASGLIRTCAGAMAPGGLLIVKDFFVENDRTGPEFALIFALHMLIHTGVGDTYTKAQVREWTRQAGLRDVALAKLTPQTGLWMARKPS
jgi:2-polyprenyl-3-methyl-5-hydroxy-6-metoxy-1,4-benzoquinol methylase